MFCRVFICFSASLLTERPSKKDESFRDDRRKMEQSGAPPRGGNPVPRSGPGNRGGHPGHPRPSNMGPPGNYGGSGSHKDIKLTLLNKVMNTLCCFCSLMAAIPGRQVRFNQSPHSGDVCHHDSLLVEQKTTAAYGLP